MGQSQNARFSFSGGVLSPRLSVRADSEQYASALQKCVNFIITPHGGAAFRQGTQYIGDPFVQEAFRLFQFHRGGTLSDVLIEVTAGMFRYWTDDALFVQPAEVTLTDEADGEILTDEDDGIVLVDAPPTVLDTNPYLLSELEGLYFTNQESLGVTVHNNHAPFYTTLELDGSISASALPFNKIPLTRYNDIKSPVNITGNTVYTITFPASWAQGNLYTIRYDGILPTGDLGGEPFVIEQQWHDVASEESVNENAIELLLRSNPRLSEGATIVATHTGGETYDVTITGVNAGRPMTVEPRSGQDNSVNITTTGLNNVGNEPAWSFPYVVEHPADSDTYYQCTVPHTSASSNEPGVGAEWQDYWILLAGQPTWWDYQHNWDGTGNDWVTDTNYAPWDRGFPNVAVFHEQRLILAGAKDDGTRFWGSRLGEYDDFVTGPNADDPFEFSLDSSDTPVIRWAHSQLELLFGTSAGDWNITAEQTLSPNDVSAVKQNFGRSFHTRPVQVDTDVFYIEQGNTKLRATRYVRDYNSFSSRDVSLSSEHLLHEGIKRVALLRVPEILIAMVTNEGGLKFMTYDKAAGGYKYAPGSVLTGTAQPMAAWVDTEFFGDILDVASYYTVGSGNPFEAGANEDSFYFAVNRGGIYTIEKMVYPRRRFFQIPLSTQGAVHLDGWIVGTVTGTVIEGLEHLEGQTVYVLIDDAFIEGNFVVTDGSITLEEDYTGQTYTIGVPYVGEFKTFEATEGNQKGTALGTRRKWNKIYCRVLDSALPIIDGVRPSDRTPEVPMGTAETIRIGIQELISHEGEWGDGTITIRQDRPYPTHVLGLYGEYSVENA
jgi:hypothetical protein